MKSKFKYLIIGIILLPHFLLAQTYLDTICWITVEKPGYYATNGENFTADENLNTLLQNNGVVYYEQAASFARNPQLLKIHEIRTNSHVDSVINELTTNYPEYFVNSSKHETPHQVALYDPADWQYYATPSDSTGYLWHLKKIEANKAWDVTLGDTNLVFAVLDFDIDPTHPDMQGQLLAAYDPYQPNITFDCNTWHNHGHVVASFFSAETAEQGTSPSGSYASIGFNTKFYFFEGFGTRQTFLQKALYATNILGAKVIVSSAGGALNWVPAPPGDMEDVFVREILDNGTTIVMGAGNGINGTHNTIPGTNIHQAFYPFHPSYDERIIIVSSTGKDDKHAFGTGTHSHYPEVDLCAPGYELVSAEPSNCDTTGWFYGSPANGTSFSSPIVAGTAALMYSVNPCLNAYIVQDILKNTTDPIADAQNFPGVVGTGRLNAGKAVEAAQGAYSSDLDLYIKDRPEDFGYPGSYAWGWWFDKSPDIWVRNQADGFTNFEHQEPEYSSNNPVYVYVRVWNKSCDSSVAQGNLSLYWSKASSSSSWPQNWNGTQPTIGDQIGTVSIPNLGPGESKIFEFQRNILNPYLYSNWASCLLARIEGIQSDPITVYPNDLGQDVFQNNNIALHNVTVVDINPGKTLPEINGLEYPHGRFMYVGNATNQTESYDITFEVAYDENTPSIIEEAEVHIFTDEAGWQIIGTAVENHPDLEVVGDKEFIVLDDEVTLQNISFESDERIPLYIGFSFLIDEITTEETYHYRVAQRFASQENDITGAEHFVIRKSPRDVFSANAGFDQQIKKNDSTNVNADDILEPAIYNWYDPEGNLIYSGRNATVSPEITTTYKLEVMASTDGFKDYDEVVIEVQQFWLKDITPNPTASTTNISYQIEGASSAYLMVLNGFGTVNNNYIITPNSNQVILDVSGYTPGVYNVILIVDGQAVDAKSLVVQ